METPREKLMSSLVEMHDEDISYAADWVHESVFWLMNNIYSRVAENIPTLSRGDVHIDLGSGVGLLAMTIANRAKEAVVIGVDRNPHMLPLARGLHEEVEELIHGHIPMEIYHGEMMGMTHDGKIETIHLPFDGVEAMTSARETSWIPDFGAKIMVCVQSLYDDRIYPCPNPNLDKPGVKLIADDIREMKLTRHFLGGRPVRSITHMFPGESARSMMVDGKIRKRTAEGVAAFTQNGRRTVDCAMNFAGEILAPGGSLVIVERFPANMTRTKDQRNAVIQGLGKRLGNQVDKFRGIFNGAVFDEVYKNPTGGKIAWGGSSDGKTFSRFDEARLGIGVFTKA